MPPKFDTWIFQKCIAKLKTVIHLKKRTFNINIFFLQPQALVCKTVAVTLIASWWIIQISAYVEKDSRVMG
jgi:hypothetical protein